MKFPRIYVILLTQFLMLSLCSTCLAINSPVVIYRYATSYDEGGNTSNRDTQNPNKLVWEKSWLCFKNIDFGTDTYNRIEINGSGRCRVTIRFNELTATPAATAQLGDSITGKSFDTLTTVGVAIPPITGVHDLYLEFTGFSWGGTAQVFWITLLGTTSIAQPRIYFVSPKGNDADSGTISKPFRTIARAAQTMVAGDLCYLRKGIYGETLRPRNSGVPGSPIRFEAYNNEDVVITTADRLTGWQKWKGNIYRTPMAWDLGPGYNQLYADSEQIYEARFPNINTPLGVMSTGQCSGYDTTSGTSSNCVWSFPHGNLPRSLSLPVCMMLIKNIGTPMCSGGMGLENCEIAAVDIPQESQLTGQPIDTYKGATLWKEGYFGAEAGIVTGSSDIAGGRLHLDLRIGYWYGSENRGFISGILPLLDTENEWVRSDGYAYVWMPGSVDPSAIYMSAKRRTVAVDLSGRSDIRLKGIHSLGGMLKMDDSRNCVVDDCHFRYLNHFIYFYNGSAPVNSYDTTWKRMTVGATVSGSDNLIARSSFAFTASTPIILSGLRNTIDDCSIHDFGYTQIGPVDLLGIQGVLRNSSVYNAGRGCVAIGALNPYAANKLLYNDFYHSGLFAADGGTYYTYGLTGAYSEIAYNWFRDNLTSGPTSYMYFDGGGADGISIHHNVFFPHKRSGNETSLAFSMPSPDHHPKLYNNTIAITSTDNMSHWYPIWDSCAGICSANNLDIYGNSLSKWNFVDSTRDFHLKAGSPAIDAGRDLPAADFSTSQNVVGKPDLGAYEYGGKDWRVGITWGGHAWPSLTLIAKDSTPNVLAGTIQLAKSDYARMNISRRGINLTSTNPENLSLRVFDSRGRCIASAHGKDTHLAIFPNLQGGGFYIARAEAGSSRIVKKFLNTRP